MAKGAAGHGLYVHECSSTGCDLETRIQYLHIGRVQRGDARLEPAMRLCVVLRGFALVHAQHLAGERHRANVNGRGLVARVLDFPDRSGVPLQGHAAAGLPLIVTFACGSCSLMIRSRADRQ